MTGGLPSDARATTAALLESAKREAQALLDGVSPGAKADERIKALRAAQAVLELVVQKRTNVVHDHRLPAGGNGPPLQHR